MAPATKSRQPPNDRSRRARREELRVTALGDGTYAVESPSGNVYDADLDAGECTCPDHQFRGVRCKHLRRVAIDITLGEVPAPGERDATCAACGDDLFVDREAADPVYCEDCTLEPGETVVDRETDKLVVVVESTDDRASDVRIPECGWSVADHHSNRDYDADDRVVDVLYPLERSVSPEDISPQDLRRYSFPRGRLERRD
ncbi:MULTISPECIES: SWIM zinc finger family protein [unclassified Halobacterium]|uniref:SWIM zinc finger family protein n=1 Tax=unclassified Halobacterium TaxID=2668073 RepID=UPI001E5C77F4|nr:MULTISPECIES: SWIM zinc finger family protein [unclassified Halobacterium]MCD2200596.1 SWIM zinc finger domain-containing protein [Halobacterium sp. KA-4]MCD2203113.1 SWIM zinc finger domain-containing protein [Halobacterium sp. KA-6]